VCCLTGSQPTLATLGSIDVNDVKDVTYADAAIDAAEFAEAVDRESGGQNEADKTSLDGAAAAGTDTAAAAHDLTGYLGSGLAGVAGKHSKPTAMLTWSHLQQSGKL